MEATARTCSASEAKVRTCWPSEATPRFDQTRPGAPLLSSDAPDLIRRMSLVRRTQFDQTTQCGMGAHVHLIRRTRFDLIRRHIDSVSCVHLHLCTDAPDSIRRPPRFDQTPFLHIGAYTYVRIRAKLACCDTDPHATDQKAKTDAHQFIMGRVACVVHLSGGWSDRVAWTPLTTL